MDQEKKKFLEEQLEWCKKQDRILEEIEMKLREMKEIAEYVQLYDLALVEKEELNGKFQSLKKEVEALEKSLQLVVH